MLLEVSLKCTFTFKRIDVSLTRWTKILEHYSSSELDCHSESLGFSKSVDIEKPLNLYSKSKDSSATRKINRINLAALEISGIFSFLKYKNNTMENSKVITRLGINR